MVVNFIAGDRRSKRVDGLIMHLICNGPIEEDVQILGQNG